MILPPTLSVTGRTSTQVNLSWTTPAGSITGYNIRYGTDQSFAAGTYKDVNPGLTNSFTFPLDCKNYYFMMTASNATAVSAWSNQVVSACVPPPTCSNAVVPNAPSGLTVARTGATCAYGVDLAWAAPAPGKTTACVNTYRLIVTQNAVTSTTDVPASPLAAHLPVSAGVPTTWAVKACNNAGCSVKSNIVSMTCN